MSNSQSIHWLAVGRVSDEAREAIERTGGQVKLLHHDPLVTLVGIAYDASARPDDLAFTHGSEIQIDVRSIGFSLVWLSNDRLTNAAYSSLRETELMTSQEYEARLMDAAGIPSYSGRDDDPLPYIGDPGEIDDLPF